jgi:hypothetical protein
MHLHITLPFHHCIACEQAVENRSHTAPPNVPSRSPHLAVVYLLHIHIQIHAPPTSIPGTPQPSRTGSPSVPRIANRLAGETRGSLVALTETGLAKIRRSRLARHWYYTKFSSWVTSFSDEYTCPTLSTCRSHSHHLTQSLST